MKEAVEALHQKDYKLKASGQVGIEGLQMYSSHDFMQSAKSKAFDVDDHGKEIPPLIPIKIEKKVEKAPIKKGGPPAKKAAGRAGA